MAALLYQGFHDIKAAARINKSVYGCGHCSCGRFIIAQTVRE